MMIEKVYKSPLTKRIFFGGGGFMDATAAGLYLADYKLNFLPFLQDYKNLELASGLAALCFAAYLLPKYFHNIKIGSGKKLSGPSLTGI